MIGTFICFHCILIYFHLTTAQLIQKETLKKITECDLNADIRLTCAGDEMIAIHSLQYAYNVSCEGTCCHTYASTDCFVNAGDTDIQGIRRACSGRSSCNAPTPPDKIDFTTCALEERIASVCSNGQSLTSDDAPLYLTNENYPSVTNRSGSCSCSLEVYSCSSSINMYIMDADLYLDTSNCYQTLEFLDGSGKTLHTIGCESHYSNQIESSTANSHYLKVDFISNSTSKQEGYFFIGLEASESGASFSLSCSYEQETWCVGCGDAPVIANGNVELSNVNDSSYEAAANVICDSGYETNTPTINCLANGTWPAPDCTEKAACTASEWRCTIGDCVLASQRCDKFPDCTDQSDEENCGVPVCPVGLEFCPHGNGTNVCVDKAVGCLQVIDFANGLFVLGSVCPEGLEFCPHVNGTDVCVDKAVGCSCGTVPSIPNGVLMIEDNSTTGSVANVTCNEGYIPSQQTVTCLTTGSWETVSCTPNAACTASEWRCTNGDCVLASQRCDNFPDCMDLSDEDNCVGCGSVPLIPNGVITTVDNSTTGSVANVTCDEGYSPSKQNITCLITGSWDTVSCIFEDCLQRPLETVETGVSSNIGAFVGVGVGTFVTTLIIVAIVFTLYRSLRLRRKHTQKDVNNVHDAHRQNTGTGIDSETSLTYESLDGTKKERNLYSQLSASNE